MREDQIPSFMSVFDVDAEAMSNRESVPLVDTKQVGGQPKAPSHAGPSSQAAFNPSLVPAVELHKHHEMTSTQTSESADSSPTTTLSTTDSSVLSDPSPSSSPDSPVNLIPLNNYPSTSFGFQPGQGSMLSIPETCTTGRPRTSPMPRRPRNMKGLSIQPPTPSTTSLNSLVGDPSSPSFIKPSIPAMRRKPSQLSLKTSSNDLMTKSSMEVPPSPAMPPILQRRALKHSTSSPHMLSGLKSSAFGPSGGMAFPKVLERNKSGLSEVLRPMKSIADTKIEVPIVQEESSIRMQLANRAGYEPYHENVNNEDQKSPGYPLGPIAIYGDNVYLYLEPSAEEASKFDVVINVAREVNDPFSLETEPQLHSTSPKDSPTADSAGTTAGDATVRETEVTGDKLVESPTTPKANPFERPEYIHVLWDHNTDIAPDLMRLCETIDKRTKDGKKVLIHCQQGASRSASLIIAYGLYQNPELSVNDAYYAAQAKSRWISPNMKLMYSLQDFHKELSKKRLPSSSTNRPRSGRSPTQHRLTLSVDAIDMAPQEPRTAPLPSESHKANGDTSHQSLTRPRGKSTPGIQTISAGPASAPLTCSWRECVQDKRPTAPSLMLDELPKRPSSDCGRPERAPAIGDASWPKIAARAAEPPSLFRFQSGRPKDGTAAERTVTVQPTFPGQDSLMSPRAETMTKTPLHAFPHAIGVRFADAPSTTTDGLFSPRQSMFPRDPFTFFGKIVPIGRPPQVADPRSPPTIGEAPIVRSIDDML
ncbi:hypothetical protein RJ55_01286 [Drechmeria coniospora]|nr:hypothetical protein RJ55_01286 [Drechmeria coniospora]